MALYCTKMEYLVISQVILLIGFSFLLIKATDLLIRSLNRLSRTLKIGTFAITSFLLAFATSLPELFVCVTSALEGRPKLALGVILGSNIANLSLVIGGAALFAGSVRVVGQFLKYDIFYTFLAGSLPLILLLDNRLSRIDGLILLLVYGMYNYTVLRGKVSHKELNEEGFITRILHRLATRGTEKNLAWVFLGAALLVFSSDMIVRLASGVAASFNISIILIGLFLVAIGTSLPELSFEIKAIKNKKVGMVFGNLLGSVVANSTLIIGITVLVSPIKLDEGLKVYLLATVAFLVIFNLFWFFVRTKKRLDRWEGAVLLVIYILFALIEFWRVGFSSDNSVFFMEQVK